MGVYLPFCWILTECVEAKFYQLVRSAVLGVPVPPISQHWILSDFDFSQARVSLACETRACTRRFQCYCSVNAGYQEEHS